VSDTAETVEEAATVEEVSDTTTEAPAEEPTASVGTWCAFGARRETAGTRATIAAK